MSTSLFENFLIDFVEASGGIAEQSSEGTYTILYGPQHTLKTVTLELEAAKENPHTELFLPGSDFFETIIHDATTKGRICSTYVLGSLPIIKLIQSDAIKMFSFMEHKKEGIKKIEPQISPFQPRNLKVLSFTFQIRITTDIIEESLYTVSVDARSLKVLKNFIELIDKFHHYERYEEDTPDYRVHTPPECYQIAIDNIQQRSTSLITRKKQEVVNLRNKEAERIIKYYETLFQEAEELLMKKAHDIKAVEEIQTKQKAIQLQKQAALSDIELRYKMDAHLSLVSVLVTNYPCYVSNISVPFTSQAREFDILWNPLFTRFEPLNCPSCKGHTYQLIMLRSGIQCQVCLHKAPTIQKK
ncbi:MAG: hypothetical protein JETT_2705 [Candidatus Jettenia ecosi]|uniref:Uncharacterized protein n=1 Tax=Candidatus Jettenia ecosi TaxID=2494326 RepID=A0A533Q8K9_9BACT|nr:MAG: hypothetical protein JETT_2705 [Candidatus Jettenia ecosi]